MFSLTPSLTIRDAATTSSAATASTSATSTAPISHTMVILLVVLLILLILALLLVATLLFMRQRRRRNLKSHLLPVYNEKRFSTDRPSESSSSSSSSPAYVYNEKKDLIENSSGPPSPTSALPEIRITFPEEVDEAGKRLSGRVVVVRMGENGIGLEPVTEDMLPEYEKSGRLYSVDLDRVGGLVELARNKPERITQ